MYGKSTLHVDKLSIVLRPMPVRFVLIFCFAIVSTNSSLSSHNIHHLFCVCFVLVFVSIVRVNNEADIRKYVNRKTKEKEKELATRKSFDDAITKI